MNVFTSLADFRAWRQTQQGAFAFVPTMGNLHAGHLSLVEHAKTFAPTVCVSIFVNRLQFGVGEDFEAYPRTLEADCEKLKAAGVAAVFCPTEAMLYPKGMPACQVTAPPISTELCGAVRPGHFQGVTTIVTKLFNLVQPTVAVFGKKDYQQFSILKQMVEDLNFPIEMVGVETGRAEDGLALSSRNGYLSAEERQEAPQLYAHLCRLKTELEAGHRNFSDLEQSIENSLRARGWSVDYVSLRDAFSLAPADPQHTEAGVILAAARLGRTRLLDNVEVSLGACL